MSGARWLAAIPFILVPLGPVVHNQMHPLILGMPFPLGWISCGLVMTSIVMAIVYRLDPANRAETGRAENRP